MARVEGVEHPSADAVARPIRAIGLVAAVWVSLASVPEGDVEDGWRRARSIEPPSAELSAGDNYVGHFTLIRRNAPLHELTARIDFDLTFTGSVDGVRVEISIVRDALLRDIFFGSTGQFELSPDAPATDTELRGIDQATCVDECIDGFSVFVERISGSTEGTITVEWSGVAAIFAIEGDEPDDVQFELRLD